MKWSGNMIDCTNMIMACGSYVCINELSPRGFVTDSGNGFCLSGAMALSKSTMVCNKYDND